MPRAKSSLIRPNLKHIKKTAKACVVVGSEGGGSVSARNYAFKIVSSLSIGSDRQMSFDSPKQFTDDEMLLSTAI